MEIKVLGKEQIIEIYETHMTQDFPKEELKSLKRILEMCEGGFYECLGLYEGETLNAYAYMLKNQTYLLLDYLAVCSGQRGLGYGSVFLEKIKEFYREYDGIMLECESICTSQTEAECQVRTKRIDFYLKNGCELSKIKANLFAVEFSILYIPLKEKEPNVAVELEALYRLMLDEARYQKHAKIWTRMNQLQEVLGWDFTEKTLMRRKSLCEALHLETPFPNVISLVGAGGKTTTMYQLADELAEQGLRVIVTTSTHIVKPTGRKILEISSWDQLESLEWAEGIVVVGKQDDRCKDKLVSPSGDLPLDKADVILVEADGAKQKPIKIPASHEPVLLKQTEMVIACVGLSAMGTAWRESCFRFETDGDWLRTDGEAVITVEDVVLLLMDRRGARKAVASYPEHEYRIVLNQGDTKEQKIAALRISHMLPDFLRYGCAMTKYQVEEEKICTE